MTLPAPSSAASTTQVGNRSLESIRAEFPILAREINGCPLSYLDNGATAQKPELVLRALSGFNREHNANVHRGVHTLSEEATELYEGARATVASHIGAHTREVVFTHNATAAFNLVANAWGDNNIGRGDHIVLTEMEHHSNIVPWYLLAQRTGAVLDWIGIDDEGRLDLQAMSAALAKEPKLLTITHVSNVLGTVNPVAEIVAEARAAGAVTVVDGAQAAPKMPLDMALIDSDFYGFTGHKLYGPTGIGVLYGKRAMLDAMGPFEGGGSMIGKVTRESITWAEVPAKFEAGTPPIAEAVGLGAAVEWAHELGLENIGDHESALTTYAIPRLAEIPGMKIFGPGDADDREGIISFELEGVHPHDIAEILDRHGVAVRAGHHCAQVLMDRLGVPATTRASFAVYNTTDEVDRMVDALHDCRRIFGL